MPEWQGPTRPVSPTPEIGSSRFAVEGIVRAGKTTLCRRIAATWDGPVVTIPEYSDCVEPSEYPPAQPVDTDEEVRAIATLLGVEQMRFESRPSFFPREVLGLIDRSILTIAAHCAGLDAVNGTDVFERLAMRMLRASTVAVWPTHVIYLDLPHGELLKRLGSREQDLFTYPDFIAGYRDFFDRLRYNNGIDVLWLDATNTPTVIDEQVLAFFHAADRFDHR